MNAKETNVIGIVRSGSVKAENMLNLGYLRSSLRTPLQTHGYLSLLSTARFMNAGELPAYELQYRPMITPLSCPQPVTWMLGNFLTKLVSFLRKTMLYVVGLTDLMVQVILRPPIVSHLNAVYLCII
jgi:hypothetical protein